MAIRDGPVAGRPHHEEAASKGHPDDGREHLRSGPVRAERQAGGGWNLP
jgi:hypothetical protein